MLATMVVFRVPAGTERLGGARFDRAAMQAALTSRNLWVYGVALVGGYGAYFTTSQLFTEYATLERHFNPATGGLLSAFIALAGIPASLLGGYRADRSKNLRLFIVGPLVAVAALLGLIPVVPTGLLWALGIGIGFFLIFGFASWSAVPARVCNIEPEYIATATGLMLTLAAIGGFFIPIIFGHLVPHTSFDTGWVFLAIVSFTFALVGLAGRNPSTTAKKTPAQTRTRPNLLRPSGASSPACADGADNGQTPGQHLSTLPKAAAMRARCEFRAVPAERRPAPPIHRSPCWFAAVPANEVLIRKQKARSDLSGPSL
jgi:nitrate/nitrite transporter NarK